MSGPWCLEGGGELTFVLYYENDQIMRNHMDTNK